MKLSAWLEQEHVSDDDFAARIDVSRQAVWRYKANRIPKQDVMARIVVATDGSVQPADFYELSLVKEGEPMGVAP